MATQPAILHITPLVGKASFGVGPVALNLAKSQQSLGKRADIWCLDSESEARVLERNFRLNNQTICCFTMVGPHRLGYSPAMARAIVKKADAYDIIHQHGIWTAISRITNRWRTIRRGPTLISQHGSLDAWALKRSIWKKRLALLSYESRNLREASCLHALSGREAEAFRAFGLRNPIAVIPNGISESWLQESGDQSSIRRRFGLSIETRVLLYLGRITPKKGLPMLLRAMSAMKNQLDAWRLVIAGVDEFNHQKEVESLVKRLTLEPYVQFIGPLFDQDKRDAFAAADIFVLPSHSEGSPLVVLEALGAGVPVLTTKASPWEELLTWRCGWWTEGSAKGITEALEKALNKPKWDLQEMGQRGKSLVCTRYTWNQVAKLTIKLYDWLLGRGEQPDFVIKD
ncbi:MAG: glycosyltransferase [Candidatus Aminicenantales bacterium]